MARSKIVALPMAGMQSYPPAISFGNVVYIGHDYFVGPRVLNRRPRASVASHKIMKNRGSTHLF
jgi:hypothetical protein